MLLSSFSNFDLLFLIFIAFFLLIPFLIKLFKAKKPDAIEILETTPIDSISEGPVKIKGTLRSIKLIKSPLTKSDCIGYLFNRYQLVRGSSSTSSINRRSRPRSSYKWRSYETKYKSSDFYLEDDSGKVKVKAKNLSIQINENKHEKKLSSKLNDVENLLLEDGVEYILTGFAVEKKKGDFEIVKKNEELVIMDKAFYELMYQDLPAMNKKLCFLFLFVIVSIAIFSLNSSWLSSSGLDKIVESIDGKFGKGLLVGLFVFGNIGLMLVSTLLCFILKPIKVLYDFFGVITGGTLMATFLNLLVLTVLHLVFDLDTIVILCVGILISITCYAYCISFGGQLNKMGKTIS